MSMAKKILFSVSMFGIFLFGQPQYSVFGLPDFSPATTSEEFVLGDFSTGFQLLGLENTIFQTGTKFQYVSVSGAENSWFDTSPTHFSLEFPVGKRMASCFGLKPIYQSIYSFKQENASEVFNGEVVNITETQSSKSGLYSFDAKIAAEIASRFAVNVGMKTLFGHLKHQRTTTFEDTLQIDDVRLEDGQSLYEMSVSPSGVVLSGGVLYQLRKFSFGVFTEQQIVSNIQQIESFRYFDGFEVQHGMSDTTQSHQKILPTLRIGFANLDLTDYLAFNVNYAVISGGDYSSWKTRNESPLLIENGLRFSGGIKYKISKSESFFNNWVLQFGALHQNINYTTDFRRQEDSIAAGLLFPIRNGKLNIGLSGKYGRRFHGDFEDKQEYFELLLSLKATQKWFISTRER